MMRLVSTVAVLGMFALGLTGCEPSSRLQGPVSIQWNGEAYLLAVCDSVEATSIDFQFRNADTEMDWKPIWLATGSISLVRGVSVVAGSSLSGMTTHKFESREPKEGDEFYVQILGEPRIYGLFDGGNDALN